ncbi:hypothetical protein ACOME3_000097 [Neoechinorhynchus agilis]
MPSAGSYMVWNIRPSSSTSSFSRTLATKYAAKHPDRTIVLIDLNSNAEVSASILGSDNFRGILEMKTFPITMQQPDSQSLTCVPRTILGYLDLYTSMSPLSAPAACPQSTPGIDERNFLVNASKFNDSCPRRPIIFT